MKRKDKSQLISNVLFTAVFLVFLILYVVQDGAIQKNRQKNRELQNQIEQIEKYLFDQNPASDTLSRPEFPAAIEN